ncbi:MAG: hypothetical protein NDJ19_02305 [Ramlibacter sp.]|nr:hypothetical protein [Ramlibacter sp.]
MAAPFQQHALQHGRRIAQRARAGPPPGPTFTGGRGSRACLGRYGRLEAILRATHSRDFNVDRPARPKGGPPATGAAGPLACRGVTDAAHGFAARDNAVMPAALRAANGLGIGRDLFAAFRRNALTAEEGACTWL